MGAPSRETPGTKWKARAFRMVRQVVEFDVEGADEDEAYEKALEKFGTISDTDWKPDDDGFRDDEDPEIEVWEDE